MFSQYLIIKVKGNIDKFINKCLLYKINLLNVVYLSKDCILVKINKKDYSKIKKINYFCKVSKYKILGLEHLLLFLKKHLVVLLTVCFCFILMYFIENIIIKVEVIHSNKDIINLVEKALNEKGIKAFTYKKSYNQIEKIKNEIVEEKPDKIEWLSITRKGMKYVVRVEERIITNIKTQNQYCHVIAKKDGIIKKIKSSQGEIIPVLNDYVRKGDIIVSGEIHLNEEVKNNVCANGEVLAEVWYKVNARIPLEHFEKKYTGEESYNFIINNKKMFKTKYKLYDTEELKKINIRDFRIYYVKEKEYQNNLKKYTEAEALSQALKIINQKMKVKLSKGGEIKSKKVLKKNMFNSTMEVEVFVVVLEDIGQVVNYDAIEGEESVTE